MANRMKATLTGFTELKAALENIGPELATKAGQTTIRKAAKTVADEIKARAPEGDESNRSPASETYDHLKVNIKVRKGRSKKEHTVTYNVSMGNAFWWRFIEYGTVKMTAKPFIKPAFDDVRQQILDNLKTDLGKALESIARRQRKGK